MMRTLLAVAPTSCSIVAAVPRRRVGGAKVSFAVIYLTTHKCCCGSVSTPATASQPLEQLLRPPHLGRTTARTSNAAPMVFSTPKKRPVYSFLPLHHTHLDSSGFRGDPPHLACRESPFCHPPPQLLPSVLAWLLRGSRSAPADEREPIMHLPRCAKCWGRHSHILGGSRVGLRRKGGSRHYRCGDDDDEGAVFFFRYEDDFYDKGSA